MPIKYPSGSTSGGSTPGAANTLVDAKGDLLVGSTDDTLVRKAVGTDDQVLTADSTVSGGVGWKTQDLKGKLWRPSAISGVAQAAIIDTNFDRSEFTSAATAGATGTLRLHGHLVIPTGKTCAKAVIYLVGAGSGLTHTWAVLTDQSGVILAISPDDTSATSSATSFKTFTWVTPYVASSDIAVYVGVCWVGSGIPTVPNKTVVGLSGETPKHCQNSNTSLTDPASLGAGPVTLGGFATPMWVALA